MRALKYIMVVLSNHNLEDGKYIPDESDYDICIKATHVPTISETQTFLMENDIMHNRLYVVAIEEIDEDYADNNFNIECINDLFILQY